MALVKCREYENEVSTTAKTCPKCGAKVKKTGILTWLFTIFIAIPVLLSVIIAAMQSNSSGSSSAAVQTPEQIEEAAARRQAEALDRGREVTARTTAERAIRSQLKAPAGAPSSLATPQSKPESLEVAHQMNGSYRAM